MTKLTQLERAVLRSLIISAEGNGFDFGFTDEGKDFGACTPAQLPGVISSLKKKGIIEVYSDDPVNGFVQFTFPLVDSYGGSKEEYKNGIAKLHEMAADPEDETPAKAKTVKAGRRNLNPQRDLEAKKAALAFLGCKMSYNRKGRTWHLTGGGYGLVLSSQSVSECSPEELVKLVQNLG